MPNETKSKKGLILQRKKNKRHRRQVVTIDMYSLSINANTLRSKGSVALRIPRVDLELPLCKNGHGFE